MGLKFAVYNQEGFQIKSGLWWHAYGIQTAGSNDVGTVSSLIGRRVVQRVVTKKIKVQFSKPLLVTSLKTSLLKYLPTQQDHMQIPSYYRDLVQTKEYHTANITLLFKSWSTYCDTAHVQSDRKKKSRFSWTVYSPLPHNFCAFT